MGHGFSQIHADRNTKNQCLSVFICVLSLSPLNKENNLNRTLTFAEAINEALFQAMEMDDSIICYGLGVPDPKGVSAPTHPQHNILQNRIHYGEGPDNYGRI